jgi:predicted nucleotide-binding protein
MDTEKAKSLFSNLLSQLDEIKSVRDENKRDAFIRRLEMLIRQFFGNAAEYLRALNDLEFYGYYDESEDDRVQSWSRGWNRARNLITTILEQVEISAELEKPPQKSSKKARRSSDKVFIVHGHNEAMKEAVARTLSKLKLTPIILHEMPNRGSKGLLDKLSENSDVSFAIVLLSPDDVGYSKKDGVDNAKSRPRQNVVFELGYFIGKIGREGVIPLYLKEEGFEILSDYLGITFIDFDQAGNWKYEVVRELQAYGFNVDANDLTRPT